MKEHRTSISTFSENLTTDLGSTSNGGVDSPMNWSDMQTTSAPNHQSEYLISSNETNSNERTLGENSSNAAQRHGDHNESKGEHIWSFRPRASTSENQTENRSPLPRISEPDIALPQDLNIRSEFEGSEDDNDECEEVEHSTNEQIPSTGGEENEDRPSCSLDGPRISCKRKALEVHAGQTSVAGSSNCIQQAERSQSAAAQIVSDNTDMPIQTENEQATNNVSEQTTTPRLRLGGRAVSVSPFPLHARGPAESSRRSFRLRINGSHQLDRVPGNSVSTEADGINSGVSSSRLASRQAIQNQLLGLDAAPFVENGNLQAGSVLLHVPSQSSWVQAISSRASGSSTSSISGERDNMLCEDPILRNIPRSISGHHRFVPDIEVRSLSQEPRGWNMAGGSGNSRAGSSSGANASAHNWSHRSCPQYSRRLSEIVRRSLLSSPSVDSGGQNSNNATQSSPPATNSQEMGLLPGPSSFVHTISNSRASFFDRNLDALGVPSALRSLAAASEGRSSIMSEQIRHVLDLMQRGEGLRFEELMVLDHSVLFGMADGADRHRDMRLDVDNMSYEELLALGERIGNVCTGLDKETITTHLKQNKYVASEDQPETEPCCICREEYVDGEHLGSLECGHDFHHDCIKEWLMQKNLCPICKTTGLNTMKHDLDSSQQ